jgi:hypothetical protein
MSIALACLVVISASLLSSLLRDARALQRYRDQSAGDTFHVHLTIDRSQLGEPPPHR